jgi:hypothetical protein
LRRETSSSILPDSVASSSASTDRDISRSSSTKARRTHGSSHTDVKISHQSSRTLLPGDLVEISGVPAIVMEEAGPDRLFYKVLKQGKEVYVPRHDTKVLDT